MKKRSMKWAVKSIPSTEEGIDRMIDWLDERPDPIDELPDAEPIDRLTRSMSHDAMSRAQVGSLLLLC